MKKILLPFIAVFVLSASDLSIKANDITNNRVEAVVNISPKEIIDNYLNALGGKAKLETVKTTIIENSMSVQGMEIEVVTKKMGNKFKSVQNIMGSDMIQVFDGEKGYFEQMGNKMDLPVDKIEDLKKGKTIDALSFDPAKYTNPVTEEKIDDRECYLVSNDKVKLYFEKKTGLLYKSTAKEGSMTIKSYMTVDGIKFPEMVKAQANGQEMIITTKKVTINSGVTDNDFKI